MSRQDVEFQTIDNLTLRGWLYPGPSRGAAIILTPGFACVKEMFGVAEVAEAFQEAGYTALVYDPRCTGASDGLPRQEISPQGQISDYSDALSWLATQPTVDPGRITFWGYYFSGMVALCAGALDKRACSVISTCPLTDYTFSGKRTKLLAKAMKDAASRAQGNSPYYLPILTERGESPSGFGGQADPENYQVIQSAMLTAPTYQNRATIQSYYKIAMWSPLGLVPEVKGTRTLVITPGNDEISKPEAQTKLVQSIGGGKVRQHVQPNKGHMDILSGDSFEDLIQVQVGFLEEV